MKTSEVQGIVAAILNANAATIAFAPCIVEDGKTDNESVINDGLRDNGGAMAIRRVGASERDSAAANKRSLGRALVAVIVWEDPNHAHSPRDHALYEQIISGITARQEFQWESLETGEDEKGAVVALIQFTASVLY